MNESGDTFTPENVEERIELLSREVPGHEAERALLRELCTLYEEDMRLVERIWRRLKMKAVVS